MLESIRSVAGIFGPRLDPDELREPDLHLVNLTRSFVSILRKYFRADILGLDRMPAGKALVVGNHNGGITFFEPFFLGDAWHERTAGREPLYFLGHDAMVALPAVGNMLIKLGVVRASHGCADRAFSGGHKVVVFPGGNFEAFRPFKDRYRIDFGGKTGFAKLAIRNQVPVVPFCCIGGHETFFVLYRGEKIAELTGVRKYLRSESFPIFLGLPWGIGIGPIFHLPLPAKIVMEIGEPIPIDDYPPETADDPEKVQQLAVEVERTLQGMMDVHAKQRAWPILG